MKTLLIWMDDNGAPHCAFITHSSPLDLDMMGELLNNWRSDDTISFLVDLTGETFEPSVFDDEGVEADRQYIAID